MHLFSFENDEDKETGVNKCNFLNFTLKLKVCTAQ
jgi:hypothetical protein